MTAQLSHQILTLLPRQLQDPTQQTVTALVDQLTPEQAALIGEQGAAVIQACASSPWLSQVFLKDPARFYHWLSTGIFDQQPDGNRLREEITNAANRCETRDQLKLALHTIHLREEAIIAWRDLNNLADLAENLAHISQLAENILTASIAWLTRELAEKHGTPMSAESNLPVQLTLLAMGKLGGGELNFHSDIDLIALFDDEGETTGTSGQKGVLSNQEFFTRLIRALVDLLQNPGDVGQLYNVDLRLRPFGDSGALVITGSALEAYYTRHGREWERYALIKARPVAVDSTYGTEVLESLSPFIYRRYLDYGAFQSLRELKQEIDQQVERSSRQYSVKLGHGGIREIEFIVQALQLVHGGRDPSLCQPALATVMQRLEARGDLSTEDCQTLRESYHFLRRSEHRIQMLHHRQQHQLPADETDLLRLAVAMGFDKSADYLKQLEVTTQKVSELFADLLAPQSRPATRIDQTSFARLWSQPLTAESSIPLLDELGFVDSAGAFEQLLALQKSRNHLAASALAQQRLQQLLPNLLTSCADQQQADVALSGTLRLLDTILRRSAYLSLLYENPSALQRLCQLCAIGDWVTGWLCQHPVLLDELLDSRSFGERPDHDHLTSLFQQAIREGGDDLEQQMNRLRDQRNAAVLQAAMLDISAPGGSGDLLTEVAELVLESCLNLAWQQLVQRHGAPPAEVYPADSTAPGLLILGYGKLGSRGLSYRSDLDLVLLQPDCSPDLLTTGPEPTPLHRFYSRVGQRLIQLLSTQTTSGRLYEVDVRLRPSGNAGPIVSELQSFIRYQLNDAHTWEHQALVHARPICGDPALASAFSKFREQLLSQPRDRSQLLDEITSMRARVQDEKNIVTAGDQLKLNDGGMLDIEFFGQYLVLLHSAKYAQLTTPTTTTEILAAAATADQITAEQAQGLTTAYTDLINCRRLWELGQPVAENALNAEKLALNQRLMDY